MKIRFSTRDITVPDRIYAHARMRIDELEPLFRRPPEAVVVFSAEHGRPTVEITILSGSTIFRAIEETSDMLVSIDAAVSTIRRRLRGYSEQLKDRIDYDAFEKDSDDMLFIPEIARFNEPAYRLVRSKQFTFGSMTTEEAVLQMNLIGHAFFAFRNEDRDGVFSVVYRRNDGGYGVLIDKG